MNQHAPHVPSWGAASNAALLIDFDNVTMGIRSDLQTQLRRLLNSDFIKGKVAVQRAYADWRRYPQYIAPLSETSIDLIYAPAFGSNKKNATDIRLAIDALELVFTRPEIGTFILLSGDSDFSSLVLKLKEYGKYVIGVGIRDSASDLLVQNCHEYYSYGELTGLTLENVAEVKRRDPWELVVEAVVRMQANDDVMRSDRLKQVMQDLDPHFDEKDAGVSKFSRFVLEASRRGLLTVNKLENGQFEVRPGPDANVPPPAYSAEPAPAETPKPASRKRSTTPDTAVVAGMALGEAFQLLKRAMEMIGAIDEESTDAAQVRELMIQLADNGSDPLFEARRFHRFLRQAHDASAVELVKSGSTYLLKLNPNADIFADDAKSEDKSPRRKKSGKTSRSGRSRSRSSTRSEPAGTPASDAPASGEPSPRSEDATSHAKPEPEPRAAPPAQSATRRKGVGVRTGSRGRKTSRKPTEDASPPDTPPEAPKKPEPDSGSRRRSETGGRGGGRNKDRGASRRNAESAKTPPKPKDEPPTTRQDAASPAPDRGAPPAPEPEDGGLFKRVSAAVQRALLGDED